MVRRKEPVIPDAILDQLLAGGHAKSAFDGGGLAIDELSSSMYYDMSDDGQMHRTAWVAKGDVFANRTRKNEAAAPSAFEPALPQPLNVG